MSIFGYFARRTGPLWMPKGVDELGIRWTGPVLEGRESVEEALATAGGRGSETVEMDEYDRVLRDHCRLEREG